MRTFSIYVKTLSTSTLMQMKKAELVEYVRMCERNLANAYATLDQQAVNFKKLLDEKTTADQWIPVTYHEATEEEKEVYGAFPYMLDCKLPDDGEEILVCTKSGCVWTDTFFNDDGCYLDGGYDFTEIAAWMPLPEPYKGGIA